MKKFLVVLLSLGILLHLGISTSYAISFSDLETSHWAYKDIMLLANQNIINGYENGTYKPEQAVTRGEFLKLIMVALYEGNEYFEVNNFAMGHWAMPYAIEAAQSGYLMDGTSLSGLNNHISRKEMVNILAKICLQNKIQKDEYSEAISFSDINSLDEATKLYIDFVTENSLINGYTDGTFKPDKTMTRAEVATVMSRFLNLKNAV